MAAHVFEGGQAWSAHSLKTSVGLQRRIPTTTV